MYKILTPTTKAELDEYYECRWRLLREPWNESKGTERDEIEDIFSTTCTQWILEIKKAIDLYHSNHPDFPLKKLIVSGGGAKVSGLMDFLAQETGLTVEIFNPFLNMSSNSKKIDPEYLKNIGPEMAIATGIALRPSII